MYEIFSDIRSGLSDRAFSILKIRDSYLSIKQAIRLTEFAFTLDSSNVLRWMIYHSSHRFEMKINVRMKFQIACRNERLESIKLLLLDSKIDVDLLNDEFQDACRFGRKKTVKLLLSDERVDPSADDHAVLRYVILNFNRNIIKKLLIDGRADPSLYNNKILEIASSRGDTKLVKLLLSDKRVDPSTNNNPFMSAITHSHTDIQKLLLSDKRVDPSAENNSAIKIANNFGRIAAGKILLTDPRVDSIERYYFINSLNYDRKK